MSMTGHCNGNSGAHVQGGRQLDLAGWVPVDDSIQVWRPILESACMARVLLSPQSGSSINFSVLSHGSLLAYIKILVMCPSVRV